MPPAARRFGELATGESVEAWTLRSEGGLVVEALTYGGIVRSILLPDGTDVVLGFDSLPPYLAGHPYYGAITGRVAGRIRGARFVVDGEEYRLAANDGVNHLHGGVEGFNKKLWRATASTHEDGSPSVAMRYLSADGDQGYPGEVDITVRYTVRGDNALVIESTATATKATPLSVMNHSYFHLAGSEGILDHELQVFADRFVPMGEGFLPLDRIEPVDGANDLREPRLLRDAVEGFTLQHGPLYPTGAEPGEVKLVARLRHAASGRAVECWTDAPYLQVYTGAYLPQKFAGLCLECEGYSNGANAPHMGSTIVRPGEVQRVTTVYKFFS